MSRLPSNVLDTSGCLKNTRHVRLVIQITVTVTSAGTVTPQYLEDNNSLQHHFSTKTIVNLYSLNVYNMYISIPDWTLTNLYLFRMVCTNFPSIFANHNIIEIKTVQFGKKSAQNWSYTKSGLTGLSLLKLWIFDLLIVAVPWMTFKNLWFY